MGRCGSCQRNRSQPLVTLINCSHQICGECINAVVNKALEEASLESFTCPHEGCEAELHPSNIQNASEELYNIYLQRTIEAYIQDSGVKLIQCANSKCKSQMEWIELSNEERLQLETSVISQKAEDGRALTREAWIHFNSHRIRCRECGENFCAQCAQLPYHLGMNCEQYQQLLKSRKCRFCQMSLSPSNVAPSSSFESLRECCNHPDCLSKREVACHKVLSCGHFCGGVRDEPTCLPCLDEHCLTHASTENSINLPSQTGSDFCSICWVSS
jgi:hypothetical protein